MLAITKPENIFDLEGVVEMEEVWLRRDREIDKAENVEWSFIEHPRNAIVDAKNYMRVYLYREKAGLDNAEIEKKKEEKLKEKMKKVENGEEVKPVKYKALKDQEINDSLSELKRIEEKLVYLHGKKTSKDLSPRKKRKFALLYEYLWQYRKSVRNAASRLKDRELHYEECCGEIEKRERKEIEYIRANKTTGDKYVDSLKGSGAKALVGLGAAALSIPITDKWPYWLAVGVTGTFVGHFALRTYAWSSEDKAVIKYKQMIDQETKKLEKEKSEVYVQTTFQALNFLEDILDVNTRRRTFTDYVEDARKI